MRISLSTCHFAIADRARQAGSVAHSHFFIPGAMTSYSAVGADEIFTGGKMIAGDDDRNRACLVVCRQFDDGEMAGKL